MLRWAEKIDKVKWHPKRNPHAKIVNSIFDNKDYKLKSDQEKEQEKAEKSEKNVEYKDNLKRFDL